MLREIADDVVLTGTVETDPSGDARVFTTCQTIAGSSSWRRTVTSTKSPPATPARSRTV